jgi:hypothetical protein
LDAAENRAGDLAGHFPYTVFVNMICPKGNIELDDALFAYRAFPYLAKRLPSAGGIW